MKKTIFIFLVLVLAVSFVAYKNRRWFQSQSVQKEEGENIVFDEFPTPDQAVVASEAMRVESEDGAALEKWVRPESGIKIEIEKLVTARNYGTDKEAEVLLDDKNGVTCCRYEAVVYGEVLGSGIEVGNYLLSAGDRKSSGLFRIKDGKFKFAVRAFPPAEGVVTANIIRVQVSKGNEVDAFDEKRFYVTSLVIP